MRPFRNGPMAKLIRENARTVKKLYPDVTNSQLGVLRELSRTLRLSVRGGDLLMLNGRWYVTHPGLLRVAQRRRCAGIRTELDAIVSSPRESRWVFKATVLKSGSQRFVGYGDADPSNVSPLVHGAEMRVGRNASREQGVEEGVRHWHLLDGGDRIFRWPSLFGSRVQEAAATCQWQWPWRPEGSRSSLPADSPAPA
jgi:hypothetical protein